RGLAVVDFHPVSGLTARDLPPIWDGEWSGLPILQIMSDTFGVKERCFSLTLDNADTIQLWELTKDGLFDYDGNVDRLVTWELEGASYQWKDGGWSLKQLEWGDIWYDQLASSVAFSAYYRPDQDPNWQSLYDWQSCGVSQTCDATVDPATGCAPTPP